jgi:nucleotidyltransferase substrate binding protein (TIGR01987 family)
MVTHDIRWIQRFSSYTKAFAKLSEAVQLFMNMQNKDNGIENDILKEGLIQRFEYTHELAWNVMKDYAEYQGNNSVGGYRDATREALQLKIIDNGLVWMDMISSRNITSHTYNEDIADEVYNKILHEYYAEFLKFKSCMERKQKECDTD